LLRHNSIFFVDSIYSLFGHPNRQNPLICKTTVIWHSIYECKVTTILPFHVLFLFFRHDSKKTRIFATPNKDYEQHRHKRPFTFLKHQEERRLLSFLETLQVTSHHFDIREIVCRFLCFVSLEIQKSINN